MFNDLPKGLQWGRSIGASIFVTRGFFKRLKTERRKTGGPVASFKMLTLASDAPDMSAATNFVASALRAVKGTSAPMRRTILTDIAATLSCSADELDFLFNDPVIAANDSDPVEMPDYGETLRKGHRAFAR